jgi:outer membrane biosynthesis protein TonB
MADFQILDEFDELEDSWSWQKLLKPSTMVAIGLHTLVLVVPIAGSQNHVADKPKPPEKKDEQVKLTTLSADAVVGSSAPSTASASSSSTPTLIPKPSDDSKPSPSPSPSNSPKASATPSPSPSAAKSPESKISPKAIPTPSPKSKDPAKTPSPTASPSSKAKTPAPSPKATTQTPKSPASPPKAPPAKPVTDFAVYPGATNGTGVLNGKLVSTDSIDKVAAFYEKELKDRGFEPVDESKSSTEKVFRINKGDKYLSIIQVDGKTVIARASSPLDKSKFASTAARSPEETAFDSYLEKASFKAVGHDAKIGADVASPDSFVDKDGDVVGNIKKVGLLEVPPAQAYSDFSAALSQLSLPTKEVNDYGGGKLYEISKGGFTNYLNFVPSKDGKSTYVVAWTTKP